MRRLQAWITSVLGVPLILSAGCAEELGPEVMETTRVTGVVTEAKVPVGKGWIEFLPYVGTVGKICSAPLRPDGSFVIDDVAVGLNRIGITGAKLNLPRGRRFFDPLSSPILRRVTKPSPEPIKIDLYDEVIRAMPTRPPGGQKK